MAAPTKEARKLTFVEIVMYAEADVIKAAYEARVEVDKLLAQREEAYRRIAELEAGVERVVGEPGLFAFPPPPLAVAGMEVPANRPRRPAKPAGEGADQPDAPAPTPETAAGPHAPAEAEAEAPATETAKPATKSEGTEKPPARGSALPGRAH